MTRVYGGHEDQTKLRQQLGHELERVLGGDYRTTNSEGKAYRESHQAGDKQRHGDIARYEVTLEGQERPSTRGAKFGDAKLDQIWRDLVAEATGTPDRPYAQRQS